MSNMFYISFYNSFFMNEKVYLVALHKIWIDHKKLFLIFEKKQNYKEFYDKINYSILKQFWYKDAKIESIIKYKNDINLIDLEKMIIDLNVKIITFFDEDFPFYLKNIFNVPFLIYLRWNLTLPWIAFIGSRNITSYWQNIIELFIPEIWKYFSIISWWAYGCDSYSHEIALKNNFKTICVIWTWIDLNYPSSNKKLYDEIIRLWWAILSIFPFWEIWNPYNFPIRNEIVAWLSKWIFVVEAREKSGSLITVKLGLDLWKDIFTPPWDIFRQNSIWCNNLIVSSQAKMVLSPNDVLCEYNILNNLNSKKDLKFSDELEKNIYNILLIESLNIDEIAFKINLDISSVLLKITILELWNIIRKNNSWKYEII